MAPPPTTPCVDVMFDNVSASNAVTAATFPVSGTLTMTSTVNCVPPLSTREISTAELCPRTDDSSSARWERRRESPHGPRFIALVGET